MEAASSAQITALLARLSDSSTLAAVQAAQSTALQLAKLKGCKVSLDDISRLSQAFLEDRRLQMKGVLGEGAYATHGVHFAFFPVVDSFASTFIDSDSTTVLLSLGLVEALRLGCAAGQLESAIATLQNDPALVRELEPARFEGMVNTLRSMTQYFNACAVLHFKEPKRLPDATGLLDDATRHRVDVTLEAVLMFLLHHELGHVDFRRSSRPGDVGPHLVWEFAVPESSNSAKDEEFYADAYALRCVPSEFALPMVHAATFFLHLHNYVDAASAVPPTDHPLCVNRIAALYALATDASNPEDIGHRAVAQAVASGADLWTRQERVFSLPALRRFVNRMEQVDWRPAQEALQLFSRAPW